MFREKVICYDQKQKLKTNAKYDKSANDQNIFSFEFQNAYLFIYVVYLLF